MVRANFGEFKDLKQTAIDAISEAYKAVEELSIADTNDSDVIEGIMERLLEIRSTIRLITENE